MADDNENTEAEIAKIRMNINAVLAKGLTQDEAAKELIRIAQSEGHVRGGLFGKNEAGDTPSGIIIFRFYKWPLLSLCGCALFVIVIILWINFR